MPGGAIYPMNDFQYGLEKLMQLDRAQLAALAAILRHGSFDRAAAELGITQSAVSQRLRALEERIGTPLIRRGPPARATEAGAQLARHADEIALLEAQTLQRMNLAPGAARVRLAVNADSLATWMPAALARAQDAMPGTSFEVEVDDQDHSARWLREGQVSGAITSEGASLLGCDALPLGALRYRATASPGYMARHLPEGATAEALARAPMLSFNDKDGLQGLWLQTHFGPGLRPPTHRLPSTEGFVLAAEAGLGWGLNPEVLMAPGLASGRLVELIPDTPHDTPLFWQVSRLMAPGLAPLTRAIRDAARSFLIAG
ncbi:transcriptional regulator, LysR family [Pseudooceanicola antarcticus]|uniref:Transcriptional regulator, LysR family n=2 Tax=Pseudooceanicola antarcticus TaxID=1247613 RepID=A0A285IFE3_9RHOB|nr:transcriptional regulator, LysR family [Pseudooceanicola antarcticus]